MRQMLTIVMFTTLLWGAAEVRGEESAGAADFSAEIGVAIGRFEGDYGLDEDTTVDIVSGELRWFLPRGEIQVSVPYVSLDGPGDIRLVGGQPVPGFQFPRLPVTPPIGGPGGGPDEGGETVVEPRRESGLGDITVQGEYYLLSGTVQRPWVIGLARVKLPTGDDARGLGTGKTDFELGLGLAQSLGQASLLADAGYTWVGGSGDSGDGNGEAQLRNVVRLGAGFSVPFGAAQQHNALVYFENRTNAIRGLEDQRSLSAGLGTRVGADRRIRLSATAYLGLSDTVEDWGLFLRAGYSL